MPIILRLDRVMADRKMSLNELSEKVGVANVNLSKMKNGRISAIRFSTLEAICEVLDCQPGDILEFQKNKKQLSALGKKGEWSFIFKRSRVCILSCFSCLRLFATTWNVAH